MILYVMRHGIAEDASSSGRDVDRALTSQGRDLVRRVAGQLSVRRSASLPRILSSPATRAHQTAEIVRETLQSTLDLRTELGPEAGCRVLPTEVVAELARSATDAMIVGHQPWIEQLVRSLAEDTSSLRGFGTAHIAELTPLDASTWRLVEVLSP